MRCAQALADHCPRLSTLKLNGIAKVISRVLPPVKSGAARSGASLARSPGLLSMATSTVGAKRKAGMTIEVARQRMGTQCGISDACLVILSKTMPNRPLSHLELRGSAITDAGLQALASTCSPTLRSLDLSHCSGITDAGMTRMRFDVWF